MYKKSKKNLPKTPRAHIIRISKKEPRRARRESIFVGNVENAHFKNLESIIAELLKKESFSEELIPEVQKLFQVIRKSQEEKDVFKRYKKILERTGEPEKEYVGPPNYDYNVCSA